MLSTKYQWSIGWLSVAYSSICRPTTHQHTNQHYRPTLGQLWLNILANMSTKSWPDLPGVGRYVDWYDDRVSADISANMSIEYRPILLTDTQPWGSQITQDPMKVIQTQSKPNPSYFPMEHHGKDVQCDCTCLLCMQQSYTFSVVKMGSLSLSHTAIFSVFAQHWASTTTNVQPSRRIAHNWSSRARALSHVTP